MLLVLLCLTLLLCAYYKVPLFDRFVLGAKEGLQLSVRILPNLFAVLLLNRVMKVSGLSHLLAQLLSPFLTLFLIPKETVPLLLLRPFSGAAALSQAYEIMQTVGVDSLPARIASCMVGSTETIFYVLSVYLNNVPLKKLGYVIPCALLCNFLGAIAACVFCRLLP